MRAAPSPRDRRLAAAVDGTVATRWPWGSDILGIAVDAPILVVGVAPAPRVNEPAAPNDVARRSLAERTVRELSTVMPAAESPRMHLICATLGGARACPHRRKLLQGSDNRARPRRLGQADRSIPNCLSHLLYLALVTRLRRHRAHARSGECGDAHPQCQGRADWAKEFPTVAADPIFGNKFGNKTLRNGPKRVQSDGTARRANRH